MKYQEIGLWKKKFRGQHKYYARLKEESESFKVDLSDDQWYDLWHYHFDFFGHSRRGGRHRKQHLAALFTAFRRVLSQVASLNKPVQVFLSIASSNTAEQDALYVHTPNPNGTVFPHDFKGVTWGVELPLIIDEFVGNENWECGSKLHEGKVWWTIRPKLKAV